jgi:hypothetical protein
LCEPPVVLHCASAASRRRPAESVNHATARGVDGREGTSPKSSHLSRRLRSSGAWRRRRIYGVALTSFQRLVGAPDACRRICGARCTSSYAINRWLVPFNDALSSPGARAADAVAPSSSARPAAASGSVRGRAGARRASPARAGYIIYTGAARAPACMPAMPCIPALQDGRTWTPGRRAPGNTARCV